MKKIIVAKKALSTDLCNTIIERAKPNFQKAYIDNKQETNSIRQSQVKLVSGFIKHLDIYVPICQLIHKVNW